MKEVQTSGSQVSVHFGRLPQAGLQTNGTAQEATT